ncbi:MAG TPA: hypothetical protein VK530_01775 [Candidatus Acidoferrum sp.]|nr:hypothetical protein [Candidatus Acidoferrum sp.]
MILIGYRSNHGTALLVVMCLLAVMTVLILVGTQSLFVLKQDLKLMEQRQIERHSKSTASK